MSDANIVRYLEALLFVADGPVPVSDLARALEIEPGQVEESLSALEANLTTRGLVVQRAGQRVQLTTSPQVSDVVERFLGLGLVTKLSSAALETLAIIAYRQPITRAQVEALRGVNSDGVIRTLMARSLVHVVGQLDQAGRPDILGTTFEFLQYFGLSELSELPALPDPDAPDGNPPTPTADGPH